MCQQVACDSTSGHLSIFKGHLSLHHKYLPLFGFVRGKLWRFNFKDHLSLTPSVPAPRWLCKRQPQSWKWSRLCIPISRRLGNKVIKVIKLPFLGILSLWYFKDAINLMLCIAHPHPTCGVNRPLIWSISHKTTYPSWCLFLENWRVHYTLTSHGVYKWSDSIFNTCIVPTEQNKTDYQNNNQ